MKTGIQTLWNVHAFCGSYVLPVLVDPVLDGHSKSTLFFFDFHLLGYICLTVFSAVAIFIFAPMETSTIDTWFLGDPAFLFMTQSTSYQNPSLMRLENTSPALESYPPNIENPVSQTR